MMYFVELSHGFASTQLVHEGESHVATSVVLQDQLGSIMAQLTKQILFCMPRGLAGSNRCTNKRAEL
jgi:hypothetical protein